MLTRDKWPVLLIGVAVATVLSSSSYAQSWFTPQSSPGDFRRAGSANFIKPTDQARRSMGICRHRAGCQYCCYYPSSGSSTCTFDIQWCGQ